MNNSKELGFLFGYLEKSAGRFSKGKPRPSKPSAPPAPKPSAPPAPSRAPNGLRWPVEGRRPAGAPPPKSKVITAPQKQIPLTQGTKHVPYAKSPAASGPSDEAVRGPLTAKTLGQSVAAVTPETLSPEQYTASLKASTEPLTGDQPFIPLEQKLIPLTTRLSNFTGLRPNQLGTGASLGLGYLGGKLVSDDFKDPNEEALRTYLMANPFAYNQMNPYAASMMG